LSNLSLSTLDGMEWLGTLLVLFWTIEISLAAAPKIKPFAFGVSPRPGGRETIHCTVSEGSLPLSFTWLKDAIRLKDTENIKIVNVEEDASSLKIKSVSPFDSGNYTCSVSNAFGVDDFTASLFVRPLQTFSQPSMTISPAKLDEGEEKFSLKSVKKGETVDFRCKALGDEPLQLQWFREKLLLDFKHLSRYDHYESRSSGRVTSELTIRFAERTDSASYTCLVKNLHGQQEKTVKLLVLEVPESPVDVRVNEIWSKSVSLSWSHPFNGNSPITKYVLRIWRDGVHGLRNHRLHEEILKPSFTSHIIKDLQPGTSYALSLTAVNDVGHGESSPITRFTTGEEEPSAPPTDVQVEPRGSKSVLVTWRAPPRNHWNGNFTGFYVQYRTLDATQPYIKSVEADHVNNTQQYLFIIDGLTKSRVYLISVKAFNKAGAGPASHELAVTTLSGDPPRPPNLNAFRVLSKSLIKVSWKYTGEDIGDITGYTVYCLKDDRGHALSVIPVPRHHYSYIAQNLEPGFKYTFTVTASNAFGESEPSQALMVHLHSSNLRLILLMAESNLQLLTAFIASVVVILLAIVASCLWIKKAKVKQEEELRKFQTIVRTLPRHAHSDKCSASDTYATIPADRIGQAAMRPSDSNSQSSSYGYGMPCPDSDVMKRTPTTMKKSKDYEEIIYDDAN